MRRAWVALLCGVLGSGCGFQASKARTTAGDDDGSGGDPIDAAGSDDGSAVERDVCLKLKDAVNNVDWSGCARATPPAAIDVQTSTSLDTTTGASVPAGLGCLVINMTVNVPGSSKQVEVCALAATSITLRADATLRAHGARPLVLIADSIDLEGRIDVASHSGTGGDRGAGSNGVDCNAATAAVAEGGGAGGTFEFLGGNGGDQGASPNTHGVPGGTVSSSRLRGGCDGASGGDGSNNPPGSGGAGGGVIWIVSNRGMLKLGSTAVINASGAGGVGGKTSHHGGSGGGSGGMIVLQSTAIQRDGGAKVFANGGHGGGGDGNQPGEDGGDPDTVSSGGGAGAGNGNGGNSDGDGGHGYAGSGSAENGHAGAGTGGGYGGGGGGGGGGAVRVASTTDIGDNNVSPNPVQWTPAP